MFLAFLEKGAVHLNSKTPYRRALAVLLPTTLIALSPSCGTEPSGCPYMPCPSANVAGRIPAGKFTISREGDPAEIYPVTEGCTSNFYSRLFSPPTSAARAFTVSCKVGIREISIELGLLDALSLVPGMHTWTGAQMGLEVRVLRFDSSGACSFTTSDGTVTLDVTEVEGGTAPAPEFVTSDYLRRFTAHVELARADADCGDLSVTIDLEAEQTPNDVTRRPDDTCVCL